MYLFFPYLVYVAQYFCWVSFHTILVGMAIWIQLADTRPGLTLIGRILLSSIKNRVRYGFKEKKKIEAGLGRVWVLSKKPETRPE